MIQISTPTQAPSPPIESSFNENLTADSPVVWGNKAQKKGKSGVFAKLLENLTGKGKKGGPEVNGLKADGLKVHNMGPEESGAETSPERAKIRLLSGRSDKLSNSINDSSDRTSNQKLKNSGREFPNDIGIFNEGAISGFLKPDRLAEQSFKEQVQTKSAGPRSDSRIQKEFRTVSTAGGSFLQENEGGASGQIAEKGAGNRFFGASLTGSEKGSSEASEFLSGLPGGDRAKNSGRGTAELLRQHNGRQNPGDGFGRQTEAGLFQSQEMARPGISGPAKGGERENSRLSELRSKKGRDKLNIEVRDLRTGEPQGGTSALSDTGGASRDTGAFNPHRSLNPEIEIPVDLSFSPEKGSEGGAGKTRDDSSLNRGFEEALARELRGNLSTDIVRDAAVIVRNGGEGTIRLSLHPASLGNVKIRLEMTENKITGHIIVESNEALRAFEQELPVLEKAFKDSGFSETNLDMFLAQDGGNFGNQEQRQEGDFQALAPALAASRYDGGSEGSGRIEASPFPGGAVSSASPGRKAVNLLI